MMHTHIAHDIADVTICRTCGSLVQNIEQHRAWHGCDHNEIPIRKWFRRGWMCVRCDRWRPARGEA